MRKVNVISIGCLLAAMVIGVSPLSAARKPEPVVAALTPNGEKLQTKYSDLLKALQTEIASALPKVNEPKRAALNKAREATKAAQETGDTAQKSSGEAKGIEAKIANWKRFWIGGAVKNIAKAEAALKAANADADREAAKKDLAKWQANKEEGEKKIKEAQADLEKAKVSESALGQANQSAQAALSQARTNELNAARALLAEVSPLLSSDTLDAKLVKAAVLAEATPRGLADFAQQDKKNESLVEKLLSDDKLMKEMLVAGGANRGKYGRAMEIYTAIQQASPKAREGIFQRLALAVSLEHAVPVVQANAKDQVNAPATVDPVTRYLHYEKAYLAGELDPAFKDFSTWEYRMVVEDNAPDEILAWGRQMLRTYRPDHVYNPNYGWRYSAAVKTDVRYGSQNVSDDLPSLNEFQNIPKDGGVCGRRAFFGRFILRSFGIPVWGVTQHKHAAVSHWTPKGWVVNLGAGFNYSWWDKDEAPLSGPEFLLEAQAREHAQDYMKVLRAQWVSRILGEQAFNERKKVPGGLWSSMAHDQAIVLASSAIELAPLGQELAEANEPQEKQNKEQSPVAASDQRVVAGRDGSITVPAAAHGKSTGPAVPMKSYGGGMQIHCGGGFKTQYVFEAPQAGKYALTARVATLQEGQKFLFAVNDAKPPVEAAVPYTIGLWQQTRPVEVPLVKGQNVLNVELREGSRGVTIKEFTLTPVK